MRFDSASIGIVCLAACFVAAASAQQPPAQPSALIAKAYNVSDLVRLSADYPLDSQIRPPSHFKEPRSQNGEATVFPGSPSPASSATRRSPGAETDPLARLIVETIEPGSWTEEAKIAALGNTLVIRQTKENHEKIQQLLDELRRSAGPAQVVTVRSSWVLATAKEVPSTGTEVSGEWMAKQKPYCDSWLTCFTGQTVHISSGTGKLIATDMTPVVANGAVAFDPTVAAVLSGVTLQISPQLVPGVESAIVDIQTTVSEPSQNPEPPMPLTRTITDDKGNTTGFGTIDRMNTISQEFKTTARVPLKKWSIVGGMTLEPASAAQDGRGLYLIISVEPGR
jgi:type II secretory pathway component GspD/PulD (secretin)